MNKDGSSYMVAEQIYMYAVTSTTTVNGTTTTTTTYHYVYGTIIIVHFDPVGNIVWQNKVPKMQHTTNDGGFFSSYALAHVGSDLFLVFNDHPNNLYVEEEDHKISPMRLGGRNAMVVIVQVDKKGNIERSPLIETQDFETITRPKVCQQVGDNEMIIFGQKRRKQRFAKVVFE